MFRNERYLGYFFIGPTIIVLALVMLFPLIYAFLMSFFSGKIVSSQFAGLSNYFEIFSSTKFWDSIIVTLKYTVASVGVHFILGMILALLLNHASIFNSIARVLILIPWMIGEPIVAIIWKWLFDPSFGFLNYVLLKIGLIESTVAWLGDPNYALLATIVVNIWRGFPFIGLLLLAGLQAIPQIQYEAAIVDGANRWKVFRFITLPNLRHVIIVALTLDFIWTMRSMALVNVLTKGGPGDITKTIPIKIYEEGFEFIDLGSATAMSVVLFFILFIFVIFFIKFLKTED